MHQTTNQSALPRLSAVAAYGAPAFVLSFAGMPLYVHAPDFYATECALSLGALGGLLLLLRLVDAVADPLIGHWSDRHPAALRTVMIGSTLGLVLGFWVLFHPLAAHPLWSFCAGMLLATLSFSALGINLNRLGAGWGESPVAQTRISTLREGLGLVGLMVAVILPSALQAPLGKAEAFHVTSLVLIAAALLCGGVFLRWLRGHAAMRPAGEPLAFWARLRGMDRVFWSFFGIFGLSTLASSIPAVLVLFFIRDRLGMEAQAGLFLLAYFLAGAACMPLWQVLSRRFGLSRAWGMAMLLGCAAFVWAFTLGAGDGWQYGAICVVSGIALGGELSLPPALLAWIIQRKQARSGSATYYSFLAFLLKISLALASALVLPFLDAGGFVPQAENTPEALARLSLCYALIPCLIKAMAFLLLWRGKHLAALESA